MKEDNILVWLCTESLLKTLTAKTDQNFYEPPGGIKNSQMRTFFVAFPILRHHKLNKFPIKTYFWLDILTMD